ncbi:MAG: hypothetical protein ACRD26_16585 [Vicinamibacterales bacterium]
MLDRRSLPRLVLLLAPAAIATLACSADPDRERLARTTRATYDAATGRLRQITYDSNKNGRVDTVTYFDGTTLLRTEIDADEDGRVDRWEYFDAAGRLEKYGLSRAGDGKPDAWAFTGFDGAVVRLEISTKRDGRIDRWEHYDKGIVARVEEDANGDGRPDKWEAYQGGTLVAVSFDNDGDGRPDRRLSYAAEGQLSLIESDPDETGGFRTRVDVRAQAEQ